MDVKIRGRMNKWMVGKKDSLFYHSDHLQISQMFETQKIQKAAWQRHPSLATFAGCMWRAMGGVNKFRSSKEGRDEKLFSRNVSSCACVLSETWDFVARQPAGVKERQRRAEEESVRQVEGRRREWRGVPLHGSAVDTLPRPALPHSISLHGLVGI